MVVFPVQWAFSIFGLNICIRRKRFTNLVHFPNPERPNSLCGRFDFLLETPYSFLRWIYQVNEANRPDREQLFGDAKALSWLMQRCFQMDRLSYFVLLLYAFELYHWQDAFTCRSYTTLHCQKRSSFPTRSRAHLTFACPWGDVSSPLVFLKD